MKMMDAISKLVGWMQKHRQASLDLGIALGVLAGALIVAAAAAFIMENVLTLGLAAAVAALVVGILYLSTHWHQVWSDMQKWAKQYSLEIAAALTLMLGPFGLVLGAALLLYTHWKTIWPEMQRIAGGVASFIIRDVLKPIVDGFLGMALDVVSAAATAFGWVPGLGGKLRGARDALKNFIAQTNADMNGWASSAKKLGEQAGANMGSGLEAGIRASMPGAKTASAQIIAAVAHQMRITAGNPNSPAPVTIPIGEALGMGITAGIQKQQAAAMKAAGAFTSATSGSFAMLGGFAGPSGSASSIQALGQQMAAAYGWTGAEWTALNNVAMRESGWNPNAQNPTSSAYGIAQNIGGAAGYGAYGTTPAGQIGWMLAYIKARYGDPIGAWAHELSAGWYDRGGLLPPGLSLAYNTTGRAEVVAPGGATGMTINVYVGGSVVTEQGIVNAIHSGLLEKQKRTPLGIKAS